MADVVRRLTVQGRSEGLEKVAGDLNRVAAAQGNVATASRATATVTDMASRRTLSTAAAYDRLRTSLDSTYRAEQQFARGESVLNRALQTGRINAAEYATTLDLLRANMNATAASGRAASGALAGIRGSAAGSLALGFAGGALAGLIDPTNLVRGVGRAINSLDDLGDAAQRAGVSGEQLQVLRFALERTVGSAEDADTAFSRLNISIGQIANTGKGPAAAAFQQLGINVRDAVGNVKTTGQVFDELRARLPLVASTAQRAALAYAIFGKAAGPEMAALLSSGTMSLEELEKRLRSMGGVISDETLVQVDDLKGHMVDLETVWRVTFQRMAIAMAQFEMEVGRIEHGIADAIGRLAESIRKLDRRTLPGTSAVGDAFRRDRLQKDDVVAAPKPVPVVIAPITDPAAQKALDAAKKTATAELKRQLQEQERLLKTQRDTIQSFSLETAEMKQQTATLGQSSHAIREENAERALRRQLIERDIAITPELTQKIRAEAEARADALDAQERAEKLIQHTTDAREAFSGVLGETIKQLQTGANAWETFGNAALSVLGKIEDRLLKMVEDNLLDALFGKTGTAGGGLFGPLIAKLFGSGAPSITHPTMQGAAAGSFRAAQEYGGAGVGTRLSAPLGPVTSRNLPYGGPAIGSFRATQEMGLQGGGGGSVAQQTWNFWKSKGLSDNQVAGIMGNVGAESRFNPLAPGDRGNAVGLYQHNGPRMRSLLGAIGGRDNLGNVQAQNEFAYSELMGPENAAWRRLQASTSVSGATRAFGTFERPKVFNFQDRFIQGEKAIGEFGGSSAAATALQQSSQQIAQTADKFSGDFSGSLTSLASSVGQTSNNFSSLWQQAMQAALSGGVGGGLSSAALSAVSASAGNWLVASGGYIRGPGSGTSDSIPARLSNGEFVMNARSTARFRPHLEAMNRGFAGGGMVHSSPKIEVHVVNSPGDGPMKAKESKTPDGGTRIDVVRDDFVGGALASNNFRRRNRMPLNITQR